MANKLVDQAHKSNLHRKEKALYEGVGQKIVEHISLSTIKTGACTVPNMFFSIIIYIAVVHINSAI